MPVDGPELEVVNSPSSLGASFVTRAGQVVEALTRHCEPLPEDLPGAACRHCCTPWTKKTLASTLQR